MVCWNERIVRVMMILLTVVKVGKKLEKVSPWKNVTFLRETLKSSQTLDSQSFRFTIQIHFGIHRYTNQTLPVIVLSNSLIPMVSSRQARNNQEIKGEKENFKWEMDGWRSSLDLCPWLQKSIKLNVHDHPCSLFLNPFLPPPLLFFLSLFDTFFFPSIFFPSS